MGGTLSSLEDQVQSKSEEWGFFALLHNISVLSSTGNEHIAIASKNDSRVAYLWEKSPTFHRFVDGFTTPFGQRVEPSLLLIQGL